MLTRTSPFAASMTIHVTVAILLFTMISIPVSQTPVRSRGPIIIDIGAYHRALKLPGGGGGGVRSLLAVNQGSLPKQAPHPFTPPMVPVAAKVLYQVDPEFSEEARRAKHYGTVILVVDVDTSGRAVNFRIAKSLGLGLDEKAVEAVSRWRFRPAQKDGKPVVVPATIEVNFHLL